NLLDNVGEPLLVNGMRNRRERADRVAELLRLVGLRPEFMHRFPHAFSGGRSEEHTSELQSLRHLVCRLLLEKKTAAAAALRSSSLARVAELCSPGARPPPSPTPFPYTTLFRS